MIPLIDLPAQYQALKSDIDAAVARVLECGRYVLGPEVEAFEAEFAQACEAPHSVGVNSGTSALYLSLLAAGVGPGDEVITVPYTFEATIAAVTAAGASARLVDIAPRSLTLDVDLLEREITNRTKAVIPVHLFGQSADMDPIVDVARRHNLTVIEDACQAHGATYKGRPVGSLGDLACFSFYPSKNLSTCGEGGIVVTNHAELADAVRQLRSWGPVRLSGNYRLAALQAAILRAKLPHLDGWTTRRRAIAAQYNERLAETDLKLPVVMPYAGHSFHVYAVRSAHRDALADALRARDIEVAVHYPQAVHRQPTYSDLGYEAGAFPVSEQLATEQLSLPIYPELTDASVAKVAAAVRAVESRRSGETAS